MRSSTAEAGDRKAAPAPRPSHGPGPPRPHPPHGVQQGPRNYKTLYDKELGAKETIRRYNGHIPGHPKYDVKLPLSDPRNHYIQFRTIAQADLVVPSFTVDRNTVFYPKVEVAMFDLNDNVNKAFLQQLANKVAPPIDLEVFYHPITKKHMGMAMIVFSTYEEARRFVHEYNMRTVMGSQVSCCHDPYFTLLSQRYEDATGEEMRIPVHLKGLEETILNTRRSHFAMKNEVLQRGRPSSSSLYAAEQTEHVDMDMESPTVPSVDVIQRGLDKRNTPCTPVPEVSTPRNEILVRGTNTPARPRTPPMEPPITTSAPPTVPLPAVVPPPNAFLPQIPPPMIPPFHPDFISSQSQPGPSGAPIPPIPPIPPVFGMTYPPPPPYSAVPADGSAIFPPGYPHPSIGAPVANVAEEKATTSQSEPPQESRRGKRENRSRPHKKKKKKRRRRSSDSSSSSTSGSSLNIGEYLRVEKKEMSTKYISREREGREKTIVEEIKTITKRKKYTVTESKRNDIKHQLQQTPGLQKISSDESDEKAEVEEEKFEKEQSPSPSKISEKEKKIEGHRWSSSSTDSDVELTLKKDKKTEKTLSASSSHHDLSSRTPVPPIVAPPAPPPVVFSPETHSLPHVAAPVVSTPTLPPPPTMGIPLPPPGANIPLPPTHLPPPPFPLPPMNPAIPLGAPAFNPLLPPPNFCPPPPQVYVKRDFPKVALRFVEEPPSCPTTSTPSTSSHQTLADRVASIFGADVGGQSRNARPGSSISQRQGSDDAVCDDVDDMDVDVGSSISPPPEGLMSTSPVDQMRRNGKEPRRTRQGTADKEKRQFAKNVAVVREATEKTIGEEIVDVVTKDFYKRVEGVSFEILEEVLAEIRHELEEQKRNEAQEALRAQAQMVTPEKPSDVAQLCSPLSASLNATPEKLGAFPFTINMPKLPSFRRKVRPPSPESESETRSPLVRKCDEESDDSDVAHKSSSSSQNSSESSDEVVLRRKGQAQRNRSLSASGSESSSELSSNESEHQSRKSSQSSKSVQKLDTPSVVASTAVSTASSVASSSESTPPSDDEERDASTITEEPIPVPIVEPEVEKEDLTPLWEKILGDTSLDWSEGLPRTLYHVSLTEHCYFKLPENEKKTGEENAKDVTVQVQVRVEDKQEKVPAPPKKTKATKVDRELLRLFPAVEIRAPPKPKVIYPPWTDEERKRHIYCWDCCFDPEDQEYLRQAWTDLQPAGDDAKPPPWIRPVRFNFRSWADKPRLLDKPVKKGRVDQYFADGELDGILPIEGGCARTRGYFKMTAKEKRSLIRRPEDEQRDKTVINERDEAAVRHNLVLTKESRSMHRRLLTTMGDANTDFFKVNQLKYRKKMIKFARSRIHGWGLYAMEAIAPDDMIVEYVGQKVRNTVADVREKAYERRGIGSSYLFRIDDTTVIDATRMGNFARFINHSCQPNCYAKVVTVDGDKRIVIYSKTLINKGDEITYDYKFPIEDDKVDCLCGAPNCRGTLN
ncbi:hypothetical protein RB195_012158 [Necator americanus]|uniref:[histone H3]-lysine(4) N-trimethyltransferase n=1 Tax=Necator americanus TaxID=51031 RepID=A0ABR1D6Q1_NECAM